MATSSPGRSKYPRWPTASKKKATIEDEWGQTSKQHDSVATSTIDVGGLHPCIHAFAGLLCLCAIITYAHVGGAARSNRSPSLRINGPRAARKDGVAKGACIAALRALLGGITLDDHIVAMRAAKQDVGYPAHDVRAMRASEGKTLPAPFRGTYSCSRRQRCRTSPW